MHKTITIRLAESRYKVIKNLADQENRPISNFIETATLRYIESRKYSDEFEMAEIRQNKELNASLKRGLADAKAKRGRLA
jgi:predicted transcriptional regulator